MPTMEEHYSLKEEMISLTDRCDQLRKQVETGDSTVLCLEQTLKKRDEEFNGTEKELGQLRAQNCDLQ